MQSPKACCTPTRGENGAPRPQADLPVMADPSGFDSVAVPGGRAIVGTDRPILPQDGEAPARKVQVKPFRMGVGAVTVAEFAAFVDATGYRTEAEDFQWSFVFHSDVGQADVLEAAVPGAPWWRGVKGATWSAPHGPGTHPPGDDHPVTQVSWRDAKAYAHWAGGRLPTEAEWEHAARGGLGDVPYPWGTAEPDDQSHFPCNIWQGQFPDTNTMGDGHRHTAPVTAYAPNGYGLYNMVGNVWEWTADPYKIRSIKKQAKAQMAAMKGFRVTKGGSFLCHASYCWRYRIAARTGNSPDSATPHTGFRMVWPAH